MRELIKVNLNEKQEQVVSGRGLYEFLEVKTKYKDWIKRKIEKYGFIENTDFVLVAQKRATNNPKNPYTLENEHIIKLSMAKELAMLENNEKGKQARLYFIKCEEEYKKINKENLLILGIVNSNDKIERAIALNEYQLEIVQPLKEKEKYHDKVISSEGALNIGDIAKEFGKTAIWLNKYLKDKKIQFKKGSKWNLYKKYADKGYTKLSTYLDTKEVSHISLKWTQKGRKFI